MTLYAIFDPKPGKADLPVAVPEKFSWLAAILPPVFLLVHGLWLETVAFVLGVAALVIVSGFVGGVAGPLYLLGVIWLGFAAPSLRRQGLVWRGWMLRGSRVAASADLAQLEAIR